MKTREANQTETIPGTRIRTLVVDDSPFMLKILAQTLEEAGDFDLVGTASNGHQALSYASTLSPELVLMDIHMPHVNGIQATRCIKHGQHPPVIIITTSDDRSTAKAMASQAGADAFLCKNGNIRRDLIGALRKLFGSNGARGVKSGRVGRNNNLGSAQLQHAHCSPPIKRTSGWSQRRLVHRSRRIGAQLCASSRFSPQHSLHSSEKTKN
jgi:CheY-like chemotaxis protein